MNKNKKKRICELLLSFLIQEPESYKICLYGLYGREKNIYMYMELKSNGKWQQCLVSEKRV